MSGRGGGLNGFVGVCLEGGGFGGGVGGFGSFQFSPVNCHGGGRSPPVYCRAVLQPRSGS